MTMRDSRKAAWLRVRVVGFGDDVRGSGGEVDA